MRLEWIEDILAVHDTGSLRAAADVRYLTASAFTRRIKAVEEAIGSELFNRSNKPLTLRSHVTELIPEMRETAARLRSIQNELRSLGSNVQSTRLICQHTLSVSWAPKVTKSFASAGSRMRIRSATKDECIFRVLRNESDIALVYDDPTVMIDPNVELCDRIRIGGETFIPVIAASNRSELERAIDAKEIPLVSYPRNLFLGEIQEQTLAKDRANENRYTIIAEAGLGPAVLAFVQEGLGVGWLPESLISGQLKSGELLSMTDQIPTFDLNVVAVKSNAVQSERVMNVWKIIETQFKSD